MTRAAFAFSTLLLLAACRQDMHDQPRFKPLEPSRFFKDGRSARPLPPGTVARGFRRIDRVLFTGRTGNDLATEFPIPVDRALIERGRTRYEAFCTPCHAYTGDGRGMIVQRGLTPPPSFHIDRLRTAPPGHFFDVITNGYGAMYSYAARIPVRDRWAIIAYIRALQAHGGGAVGTGGGR